MSEYITTYTGKHFEPTNPDPELIRIEDVTCTFHALPWKWTCKDILVGGTALYLLCQGS